MSRSLTPWMASLLLHLLVAGAVFSAGSSLRQPQRIDLFDLSLVQFASPALDKPTASAAPPPPRKSLQNPPTPKPKPVVKTAPKPVAKPAPTPVPLTQPAPTPPPIAERETLVRTDPLPSQAAVQSPSAEPSGPATPSAEEAAATGQSTVPAKMASLEDEQETGEGSSSAQYVQSNFTYIRDRVMASLRYPSIARRQGWSGQVRVEFTILKTGKIENLKIARSSGYPILDKQALKAVRAAEPFPPPKGAATITLPVNFVLN